MKNYAFLLSLLLITGAEAQHMKDRGTENRTTIEKGNRQSNREEILNSLKNFENRSLVVSVNAVPLFYKYFPAQVEPHRYFKYPLTENGAVYTSQLEYYKQVAQIKGSAETLYNVDTIKRDMVNLIGFAMIVGDVLEKLRLVGTTGIQDIEQVAKNINYSQLPHIPFLLSECWTWDVYAVKCGDCVYDFSLRTGFPEIVCRGMKIISGDSIMGYSAKIDISRSSSIEEVFNKAKAYEDFKSVANTFSSYSNTINMSAVESLVIKASLLKAYSEGGTRLGIAMSMMKRREKPSKILEALK